MSSSLIRKSPFLLLVAFALAACAPKKKVYTVPSVTKEIEGGVRQARRLKARGKLAAASRKLLKLSKAVRTEYPEATLTQEPVKKLMDALEWIANLCLDRSLELKNESVSATQDDLSVQFRKWSDLHRENLTELRKLLPRLPKAAVAARQPPAARPSAKSRPRPAGAGSPAPGAREQPRPEEPRMPSGDEKEPGT